MRRDSRPICHGCKLVIRKGEPRYTAAEPEIFWHWSCKEQARESFEEATRKVPEMWVKVQEQLGRLQRMIK